MLNDNLSQVNQMLIMLYGGLIAGTIYDIFYIFRRIFLNNKAVVFIFDILFCAAATLIFIVFSFIASKMNLYFYTFIGFFSGLLLQFFTIKPIIRVTTDKIISAFKFVISKFMQTRLAKRILK